MQAAFLKSPFCFDVHEAPLPEIGKDDVLFKVRTCGFCGSEIIAATAGTPEWRPFGHEFAGDVVQIGENVTNVKVGDKVVVESSTFDPLSREARNGQPELDARGMPDIIDYVNIDLHPTMGFAEYTSAPAALCVKFDRMTYTQGAMIEPLGVAMDLVRTADIRMNDDVLIVGMGPIGLMALQLAKRAGARNVYAANRSHGIRRIELAKKFGAADIICTDLTDIEKYKFARGGVDKALVTAPPAVIPSVLKCMNIGGTVAFLGLADGEAGKITIDAMLMHHRKLKLAASDAVPALYFPMCIEMVEAGMIDVDALITHTFDLAHTPEGLKEYLGHHSEAVKAVMVNG